MYRCSPVCICLLVYGPEISIWSYFHIQGTIADALVLVREHQAEAIGCATVAGFILFRGILLFFFEPYWYLFVVPVENDQEKLMVQESY